MNIKKSTFASVESAIFGRHTNKIKPHRTITKRSHRERRKKRISLSTREKAR